MSHEVRRMLLSARRCGRRVVWLFGLEVAEGIRDPVVPHAGARVLLVELPVGEIAGVTGPLGPYLRA